MRDIIILEKTIPEQVIAMEVLRIDIKLEMLITESQTTETQHDGLLYSRGPSGHQMMTALLFQGYQPRLDDLVHSVDGCRVLPQARSISERGNDNTCNKRIAKKQRLHLNCTPTRYDDLDNIPRS